MVPCFIQFFLFTLEDKAVDNDLGSSPHSPCFPPPYSNSYSSSYSYLIDINEDENEVCDEIEKNNDRDLKKKVRKLYKNVKSMEKIKMKNGSVFKSRKITINLVDNKGIIVREKKLKKEEGNNKNIRKEIQNNRNKNNEIEKEILNMRVGEDVKEMRNDKNDHFEEKNFDSSTNIINKKKIIIEKETKSNQNNRLIGEDLDLNKSGLNRKKTTFKGDESSDLNTGKRSEIETVFEEKAENKEYSKCRVEDSEKKGREAELKKKVEDNWDNDPEEGNSDLNIYGRNKKKTDINEKIGDDRLLWGDINSNVRGRSTTFEEETEIKKDPILGKENFDLCINRKSTTFEEETEINEHPILVRKDFDFHTDDTDERKRRKITVETEVESCESANLYTDEKKGKETRIEEEKGGGYEDNGFRFIDDDFCLRIYGEDDIYLNMIKKNEKETVFERDIEIYEDGGFRKEDFDLDITKMNERETSSREEMENDWDSGSRGKNDFDLLTYRRNMKQTLNVEEIDYVD